MNGDTELSPSQILERVKPDRVTVTKPEEDRRRRTIIVEKKNATYGFTLQSYGIHYKKEQEIEMITYVDHVDYDGPAFRAGMREGDVILSINGRDMEKVDHKSLVNFIKSCDSRMRMVVLFEDCVRKVELHMRYIKLQNALKCKTLELEKLCVKEKELLSGKWKTHSLPARKKNPSAKNNNNYDAKVSTDTEEDNLRRTTFSTEDVGQVQNYHRTQHHHFLIAYPRHPPYYIDAHGRAYYLHPSEVATPSSSKEYLVSTRSHKDGQRRRSSHSCDEAKYVVANGAKENSSGYQNVVANKNRNNSRNAQGHSELKKDAHKITRSKSYHQHICGGCLRGEKTTPESQENGSLEAYDLAGSSCCAAECVPTRRRRSHSHHAQKLKPSSSKTSLYSTNTTSKEYSESHSNRSTQVNIPTSFHNGTSVGGGGGSSGTSGGGFFRKHAKFEGVRKLDPSYRNLVSQNSLYSCTSTELPISHTQEQTVASYTTSLSTDTLYWDQPSSLQSTRKHSTKSTSSSTRHQYTQDHVKPVKSWDNLAAAKSHNNYSCDYLDNSGKSYSTKNVSQINSTNRDRYFNQTQSSESLFYSQNLSEGSFSCEYLSSDNPTFISNEEGRFVPVMPSDLTNQRDKASQTDSSKRLVDVPQTPEITRL